MNVDKLKEQFRQDNERAETALNCCLDGSKCSPEQKAYIQQLAQSIFSEIQEIQQFLINQANHDSC